MNAEARLLQDYLEAFCDADDYAVNANRRREARKELPDLKSRVLALLEKGGRYEELED